jgi:hypothetical protein
MQKESKTFNLLVESTEVPLAFQKVEIIKVIPHEVEKKLCFFNEKYKYLNHQAIASKKPISKIV